MSFRPAGFEDYSEDDDDFDFGDGEKQFHQASVRNPKPSFMPAGAEQQQFKRQDNLSAEKPQPSVGRGRGRGGFGAPPQSARKHNFSRNTSKNPPVTKNPGPNPILLEDLKVACLKGCRETVENILNQGINVNACLSCGWTALMHATSAGSEDVVDFLLKRGGNANFQKDMFSVLMAACDTNSVIDEDQVLNCVELLLEHGAKIGVYDRHRMSPLMYAARQGRVLVCEKLLEKGAQINKTDGRGWTALSWAASKGHGRLIRVLLDHKADPKLYTLDGQSPFDIAYSNGYDKIAGILEAAASGNLTGRANKILTSDEDDQDKNMSLESYGGLEVFLCGIELGHLVPKFQEHKITFEGFAKMTEKDLDQLGITQVGVRKKILDAICEIHTKEWDMSSLQHQKNLLSALEVTTVMANINKHISVIESSVVFAHKQLDGVLDPTEFMKDIAEVEGLSFFAQEALKNSNKLNEGIVSLQKRCDDLLSQSKQCSADIITPKPPNSPSRRGFLVVGIAAVVIGIIYIKRNSTLT